MGILGRSQKVAGRRFGPIAIHHHLARFQLMTGYYISDRCTIHFARSILRPFAYRLGRQATLIRLRLRFVMLSSSNKPVSLLPPKTLPRKRCFTFDPMCPENAMRSPLSDLAKRERVFSSEFILILSHSRSEESGLCPSYRYP